MKNQSYNDQNQRSFNHISESDVIEANKKVYNENAKTYDEIVITQDSNKRLRKVIENVLTIFYHNENISEDFLALDACGGTGNVSFIINDMEYDVELVDLSSAMIDNFKNYCNKKGINIKSYNVEINQYLENSDKKYDLIVFSSALHHLRYPDKVLINAAKCLKPGGIILTIADPTINIQKFTFKLLSFIDRGINLSIKQPSELIRRIKKKIFIESNNNQNKKEKVIDDWVAEFHAQDGIDDLALKKKLVDKNLFVLWHKRYTGGYNNLFQVIYKVFELDTSFSMIISNQGELHFDFDI
tara:strand:- start:63 stop:959 length:897 start_codon:yes stop_codon:yes gene_type:complete